jgi:hypothetical protein
LLLTGYSTRSTVVGFCLLGMRWISGADDAALLASCWRWRDCVVVLDAPLTVAEIYHDGVGRHCLRLRHVGLLSLGLGVDFFLLRKACLGSPLCNVETK